MHITKFINTYPFHTFIIFLDNRRPHKNYSKFKAEEKINQTEELDNGNLYDEDLCCTDAVQENDIQLNSAFTDVKMEEVPDYSEDSDYGKHVLE